MAKRFSQGVLSRPSKKHRAAAAAALEADFVKGSIVRLKLKAFVTYDDCEFRPGPKLNVLIGPNGTGKSSFVCAACLALGGATNLLGRAKQVGDYVKHGYREGLIEIELFHCDGNVVIQRKLTRDSNSSRWTINGREATAKEVATQVSSMNIQLSNLCQFLPQDKVVEFAKMNPVELFRATVKALNFENGHEELIRRQKQLHNMEEGGKEMEARQEQLTQQQELHRGDVERFKERRRQIINLEKLKMKRAYVYYNSLRDVHTTAKERLSVATKQLKKAKERSGPIQRKITEANESIDAHRMSTRELSRKVTKGGQDVSGKLGALESLEHDLEEPKQTYEAACIKEKNRMKDIRHLEREIQALKDKLEALPPSEDVSSQADKLARKISKCSRDINSVSTDRTRIRQESDDLKARSRGVSEELRRLEDLKQRRDEILKRMSPDAYKAVQWLRANQGMFREPVLEPIVLLIDMKDASMAKYLEAMVSRNDFAAFVCQNSDDLRTLMTETKVNRKLRVNIVQPPNKELSSFKPRHSIDDLKRGFGFQRFVKDTFDAPDPVLRFLCENNRIHDVPIGDEATERNLSQAINNSGVSLFFTPTSRVQVKTSRYGGGNSSSVSGITDKRILNTHIDAQKKSELQREMRTIQDRLKDLVERDGRFQEQERELRREENELKEERRLLLERRNAASKIERDINSRKLNVERYEAKKIDLAQEEEKMKRNIKKVHRSRVSALRQLHALTQGLQTAVESKIAEGLHQIEAVTALEKLKEEYQDTGQLLETLQEEANEAKLTVERTKSEAKAALAAARKLCGNQDISDDLQQSFQLLPDSLPEIDSMIAQASASVDCMQQCSGMDQGIVAEFEKREEEIESLEIQVLQLNETLAEEKRNVEVQKASWLGPLEEKTAQIGQRFSQFFEKMGCAGEVLLEENEDFTKYSMHLKVKFRKTEELQLLTAQHQSGGERSVSTMLYLMALQGDSVCPFRVVDEINQGMDPTNERRVFDLVVDTVSSAGTSQYFLITPKLLPDLRFSDDATVLCVYNGPFMLPHTKWDADAVVEQAKKMVSE